MGGGQMRVKCWMKVIEKQKNQPINYHSPSFLPPSKHKVMRTIQPNLQCPQYSFKFIRAEDFLTNTAL